MNMLAIGLEGYILIIDSKIIETFKPITARFFFGAKLKSFRLPTHSHNVHRIFLDDPF